MPIFGPQGREINLVHGRATTTKGFLLLRAWGQGCPLGSFSIGCPFKKITKQFATQNVDEDKRNF
jgi:hypothetical protein